MLRVSVQAGARVHLGAVAVHVNALLVSVVAWLAQRLPIVRVIEQLLVPFMRDDMVDHTGYY